MPRFRVRTLMIVVGFLALLMGLVGPGRQGFRRWSYHRSEAARFSRLERTERLRSEQERKRSADRGAIRTWLIQTPGFAAKSAKEIDRAVDRVVEMHRLEAKEALNASARWNENRRLAETAAWGSWDPLAPDVP